MTKPTPQSVDEVIATLESQQLHPTRQLARRLVNEYRKGSAIDPRYDFNSQPRELRAIMYGAAVRFSRRRWWTRILR